MNGTGGEYRHYKGEPRGIIRDHNFKASGKAEQLDDFNRELRALEEQLGSLVQQGKYHGKARSANVSSTCLEQHRRRLYYYHLKRFSCKIVLWPLSFETTPDKNFISNRCGYRPYLIGNLNSNPRYYRVSIPSSIFQFFVFLQRKKCGAQGVRVRKEETRTNIGINLQRDGQKLDQS